MRFNSLQTENPCNRQGCKIHLLYNSIKDITDETLITEIRKRGYKFLDLPENKTAAEIVKIG